MSASAPPRPVRALEGLKGVSALGIVIFHMSAALAYSREFGFTAAWFGNYYLLLDLFFVISGYGIGLSYAARFENGVSARGWGAFMWARLVRLYPLYIAVLLILAFQDLVFLGLKDAGLWDPGYQPFERPKANVGNLISSIFMTQAWGFHDKLVWNIPAWYVSALICAYMAFPFIAWAAGRLGRNARAAALIALGGGGAVALHIAFAQGLFHAPNDLSPLRAVLEFMLGYGISQLRPGPRWRSWLQLPALALVFIGFHAPLQDWLSFVFLALFMWTLLDDRGPAAWALGLRPLTWLGAASYGIFLVHQPLLSWFDAIGRSWLAPHAWILWSEHFSWNIALRFVVIVFVGWAAQRFIATPAQRLLTRKA